MNQQTIEPSAAAVSDRRDPQILAEITAYMDTNDLSARMFARLIGTNEAYFSDYRNKPAFPYAEQVEAAYTAWKRQRQSRDDLGLGLFQFVPTDPAKAVVAAIQRIRDTNDCGVIYGAAGIGKTVGIAQVAETEPRAKLFRALRDAGRCEPWAIMRWIIEECGLRRTKHGKPNFVNACRKCRETQNKFLFIVDDAQHLQRAAIDTLAFFSDDAQTPVVLVGNHELLGLIEGRSDQVWRRYGKKIEIHAAHVNDDGVGIAGYRAAEIRQIVAQYIPKPSAEVLRLARQISRGRGHLGRLTLILREVPRILANDSAFTDAEALREAVQDVGDTLNPEA